MSKINSSQIAKAQGGDRLGREMATAVITFHETVARKIGMSAAESRCLGVLGDMGTVTPGQLAQATGLTTGAITGIVDRLEKAGYARRQPNPDDRRSLLVHATNREKLAAVLGPIYGALGAAMADMSAHYTPAELEVIGRYLADTTAVLRGQTERLKQS